MSSKNHRRSRRQFLQQAAGGIGVAAGATIPACTTAAEEWPAKEERAGTVPVVLQVNGKKHELTIEPRVSLLDALREYLYLTGTKKGCDHGQCGACTVLVRLRADGTALVRTASSDIGPGTYTVMTQIAAEALGLPAERVNFELGDSALPRAPVQGGSMTVASVGSAVHEAARAALLRVLELARGDKRSPLHKAAADGVGIEDGRLFVKDDPERGEAWAEVLRRQGKDEVEVTHQSKPGDEAKKFSAHAFGAHFIEVRVDEDLGTVRVARLVSAFAAGRIINPKTARSQAIGGIVGGLGMALLEHTVRDERNARVVTANLADYRVPVHADVPALDAFFVEEEDRHANPLGAKGLAELSLVGVAAAVANAVHHATGKRVRDLPITPDKLL